MNWDFFDIVEEGMKRGYKAKWAIYQAKKLDIPLNLDDLKELREFYGHKPMWVYHTALEFDIPIRGEVKT